MATATLNGKITVFGIVNSISISSIVFKQNDTVYTIDSGPNLPRVNTDDNTINSNQAIIGNAIVT
jgi:hypothetical protein